MTAFNGGDMIVCPDWDSARTLCRHKRLFTRGGAGAVVNVADLVIHSLIPGDLRVIASSATETLDVGIKV